MMNGWRWALLVSLLVHGTILLGFSLDAQLAAPPVVATAALQVVPRQKASASAEKAQPAKVAPRIAHDVRRPAASSVPPKTLALPATPVIALANPVVSTAAAPPVAALPALPVSSNTAAGAESSPRPKASPVDEAPLVSPEDLRALCSRRPAPDYPAVARRRGEAGQVLVRLSLDAAGRISDARVATSSGSRWLDEAALAAINRWGCRPAIRQGVAVPSVATQAFSFVLEDQGG